MKAIIYQVQVSPCKSFLIDVSATSREEAMKIANKDYGEYEEYEEEDFGVNVNDAWPKDVEDWQGNENCNT